MLTWWCFGLLGIRIPLLVGLVFGALTSPTDPIAVRGRLRELCAPVSLEAQIAGQSLFNDGVGVVVFLAFVSVAGLPGVEPTSHVSTGARSGGVLPPAGRRWGDARTGPWLLGYRALKSIDEHSLELLLTLALAMATYALAFQIDVSGPIAVVSVPA